MIMARAALLDPLLKFLERVGHLPQALVHSSEDRVWLEISARVALARRARP